MKVLVFSLVLLLSQVLAFEQQDANACPQYPSCEECIAHNPCGWCSVPVVYVDGSSGPRCAGKPKDPNKPPPGYKAWTCPIDFQNDKCYGYVCNDQFSCVSSGSPGRGVPLAECLAKCFPPTYECNKTTHQCYKVEPGHGTDMRNCEIQCNGTMTTGDTTGSTTASTTGESTGGPPSPQTPGYTCDTTAPTPTCVLSQNGGVPKADCDKVCGKPSNVTPIFAIGNYRGLQISQGYVKGEWQAKIGQDSAVIVDPSGKVWAKGVVRALNNELWIVTDTGTNRGVYGINDLPEVEILTWGLGGVGKSVPTSFDQAMTGGTVFVFAKCLTSDHCQFNVLEKIVRSMRQQAKKLKAEKENFMLKRDMLQVINDACMKYPDCHSCIAAPEQCGWCSVNVLYFNGTVVGKNCAGLNTTVAPKINCTGSFSTLDCTHVTTGSTTADTTGTTGGPPTNNKFSCDPTTLSCTQSPNGTQPKDVCDAQCQMTPVVPPVLQGQMFRGLEIDTHYQQGEWRAQFTRDNVTITDPNGKQVVGKVSTVERFLTITLQTGEQLQTLWQISQGPSSQFLSWAWGAPGGPPPASFDSAMTGGGQNEFWFVSCLSGKATTVCDFSK